ncbi:MAG: hypothetical protein GY810_20640 [Aureispira sp.]|nr:hypothetical protein [Aureispira sp.]
MKSIYWIICLVCTVAIVQTTNAQEVEATEGWVVWYDQNKTAWDGIPPTLGAKLDHFEARPSLHLHCVGIAPDGGWVAAYHSGNKATGSFNVSWDGPYKDFMQVLHNANEARDNIKQIVFSPKYAWNHQAWTVLLNEHQGSWKDVPETLILKIIELHKAEKEIKSIGITENEGWIILAEKNEAHWENIPETLESSITKLQTQNADFTQISFNGIGGWVLIYNRNQAIWQGISNSLIQKLGTLSEEGVELRGISFYTVFGRL